MLFNSVHFLVFFVAVVLLYFIIPKKIRPYWLLVASYYFYMSWNPIFALLLAFSTLVTFGCGLLLQRTAKIVPNEQKQKRRKKLWIVLSLCLNLGVLIFFKYFTFAVTNINGLLAFFHIQVLAPTFSILLPVGISFYIFQALSYTIDVYRGDVLAERNLFKYALFVAFFPQLVAGPITRAGTLLPQIYHPQSFEFDRVKNGLLRMLWGYFEKLVIADRAAILINQVYDHYNEYGSVAILLAAFLFSIQIYCDFCGYSDIALGAAQVLGFTLKENFRTPYFSRSIAEFWRRWHMSLSSWFRDYIYIPLGGNRRGRLRKYRNLMVTFVISGLWHGANWTYAVWGFLHGAFMVIGDALHPLRQKVLSKLHVRTRVFSYHFFQQVFTFGLVCFCWIFFRAPSIGDAMHIIGRIFSGNRFLGLGNLGLDPANLLVLFAAMGVLLLVSLMRERMPLRQRFAQQNVWFRWSIILVGLFCVLVFGLYGPMFDASSFIYAQF